MSLTIGSLFSGIGGLELGLEWAGLGPVVWQVEKDDYCRRVLTKHWPDAKRYEDVRAVGAANLEPVDVICGGFPCQDISVAGRRAGLAGERSGLFYEFARIIRELRPRYAVLENVTALLADGLGSVLSELAAGGYDAEWDCVPASSVGAPHQRDRIFILAYPASDRWTVGGAWNDGRDAEASRRQLVRVEPRGDSAGGGAGSVADAEHGRVSERRRTEVARGEVRDARRVHRNEPQGVQQQAGKVLAHSDSGDAQGLVSAGHDAAEWSITRERPSRLRDGTGKHQGWEIEPDVGRVAHGVPARVDRLRALGNAVVPQVAEIVGHVILAREATSRPAQTGERV